MENEALEERETEKARSAGYRIFSVVRVVFVILLALGIIVAAIFFAADKSPNKSVFGFRYYSVLCFVNERASFDEVKEGDVIAFRASGDMLVTHRAVKVEKDGIITKGDANNTEDPKVTPDKFIGSTVFSISLLGKVMLFTGSGAGRIISIAALEAFVLLGIVFDRLTDKADDGSEQTDGNDGSPEDGGEASAQTTS